MKDWGNEMQGKYQLYITNPFCSTKSCHFQAANEGNDGIYVCLTKSCPADALEDWDINMGGALTATAIVASFKLKLALHNYTVAKSNFFLGHTYDKCRSNGGFFRVLCLVGSVGRHTTYLFFKSCLTTIYNLSVMTGPP